MRTLIDPDEVKSPTIMRGPSDAMSHELRDSLKKCTNMLIRCPKSDFTHYGLETTCRLFILAQEFEKLKLLFEKDFIILEVDFLI